MGKHAMDNFILESKGRCFFCLMVLPKVKQEPGLVSPPPSPSSLSSVYSLQRLSRFLKMDVRKVLEEKVPIPNYHSCEEEVKIKVELCVGCASLIGTFSKLHRQLEKIEMEVNSCVSRIHLKLAGADETGMAVVFRNLMADSELGESAQGQGNIPKIVEALRTEAIQKCVRKLGVSNPQDRIPSLQKKPAISMSPHPLGAPTKSRKLVWAQQFTVLPDTGKYVCNICSKELKNRSTFQSHYKSSHLKTKYQCTLCDKDFSRKDIYTKHHRTFHGGVFKCELCGVVFTRKLLLKQHQKQKHNTNAPVGTLGGGEDLEMKIKEEPETFENSNVEEDGNFDWDCSEMEAEQDRTAMAEDEANRGKVECDICHLQVIDLTNHLSTFHFEVERTRDDSEEELETSAIEETSRDIANVSDPPSSSKSGDSSRSRKRTKTLHHDDEITKRKVNDDSDSANATQSSSMDAKKLPLLILNPAEPTKDDGTPQTTFNLKTGRLKCNICLKEFKSQPSFRSHYKSVHLKVRFKCILCDKQFRRRDNYLIHNQSVHMGVRYKCNSCNKSFSQRPLLKKHRQTVHSEPVGTEIPQIGVSPGTGTFNCSICSKEFKDEQYYQEHYKSVHLKMRHLCPICKEDFPGKIHLRRHHQSVHMGVRFKCSICSSSFSQKSLLKKHRQTVHSEPRKSIRVRTAIPSSTQGTINPETGTFKCTLCPAEFKKKRYYHEHYQGIHLKMRHFCPICRKDFPRKAYLRRHHESVHLGVRFKCQVCEKSFSLGYNLRLHQRTTTCGGGSASELQPLPRHVCHLCGKDFSTKLSVQGHLEAVHMNLRKHLCELCGKNFKTKSHLNTHRQGVHKGAEKGMMHTSI